MRFRFQQCIPFLSTVFILAGLGTASVLGQTSVTGQASATASTQAAGTNAAAKVTSSDQIQVLTRGPVHEAFAAQTTLNINETKPIDRAPPSSLQELPPSVRPAGANVQWIPGYYAWDNPTNNFIWVSGCWRNTPPGQRWVPGHWYAQGNNHVWAPGFWLNANVSSLQYLAPPPASLETGPTTPAPSPNHFYIPGNWLLQNGEYAWRAGYWALHQPGYVWVPDTYLATDGGAAIFVPGYWDHQLAARGTLFAPVNVNGQVAASSVIRFTPAAAIPFSQLQFHLFAAPNARTYLFGNYYDDFYVQAGVRPWYAANLVADVPLPLFGYYAWQYGQAGTNYAQTLAGWNKRFTADPNLRPALTLAEQAQLATSATTKLNNSVLAVDINRLLATEPKEYTQVNADEMAQLNATTQQLQLLGQQRVKAEAQLAGVLNTNTDVQANQAVRLSVAPLALPAVTNAVPSATAATTNSVDAAVGATTNTAQGAVRDINGAVRTGNAAVQGTLNQTNNAVNGAVNQTRNTVNGAVNQTQNAVRGAGRATEGAVQGATRGVQQAVPNAVPNVPLPSLP